MSRVLAGLAAFAIGLGLASAAPAQSTTLFGEFQSICLESLKDLPASEAVAAARGYSRLPADPRVKLGMSKTDGDNLLAYALKVEEMSASDKPAMFRMCIVGSGAATDADQAALDRWVALPTVNGTGELKHLFRIEGSRKIAVGQGDVDMNAALKLGPVYVINVRRGEKVTSFAIAELKLK